MVAVVTNFLCSFVITGNFLFDYTTKMTEEIISQSSNKRASKISGTSSRKSQSIKSGSKSRTSIEDVATENSKTSQQDEENPEVEEEEPFSYIKMLDVQRELQEPLDITLKDLKQISEELGLIKLCWPELSEVNFEDRTNFPDTYLKNSNKEKLLLLYAENFRRQFCYKYPERKPLLLACDNECGMQVSEHS